MEASGEARVIEDARGGDAAAFGQLVERYQEVAFRAAYLIVRDAQTAEDVAQDAFLRAFRGLRGFRAGSAFRPWLLRIVTNSALNELRARKRRGTLTERAGALASAPTPAPHEEVAAADEASTLARAIAELPDDDRTVLYLRYFLELPERENRDRDRTASRHGEVAPASGERSPARRHRARVSGAAGARRWLTEKTL